MACLCDIGSHPCCSERLHISVTNGSNSSKNSVKVVVGIGSSEHDLDLVDWICFLISSGLYNFNLSNTTVDDGILVEVDNKPYIYIYIYIYIICISRQGMFVI